MPAYYTPVLFGTVKSYKFIQRAIPLTLEDFDARWFSGWCGHILLVSHKLESQELLLQQRKRELKVKLESGNTNAENQVCQELDTNHAVSASDEEQIFKYLKSWRQAANEEIPDMFAKDDEVLNAQVIQTDQYQAERTRQTPPMANIDIQAENFNFEQIME